jgi:hypothetical protein
MTDSPLLDLRELAGVEAVEKVAHGLREHEDGAVGLTVPLRSPPQTGTSK